MKKRLAILAGALAPLAIAGTAFAQDTTLTPEETSEISGAAAGGLMGLLAASLVLIVIAGIVGLIFLILWIWALVDVIGRKFPDEGTKKLWLWLVILSWPLPVIVGFIPGLNYISPVLGLAGAIIVIVYLASIRKRGTKPGAPAAPAKPEEK